MEFLENLEDAIGPNYIYNLYTHAHIEDTHESTRHIKKEGCVQIR